MAVGLSIRLQAEPVRSLGFASISGTYAGIGTEMDRPIRMFMLQNLTDQVLMISFDGVNDHFPMPSNGYVIFDVTANKASEQGFYLSEGTRFYAKDIGVATTLGSVYLTVFYGYDE